MHMTYRHLVPLALLSVEAYAVPQRACRQKPLGQPGHTISQVEPEESMTNNNNASLVPAVSGLNAVTVTPLAEAHTNIIKVSAPSPVINEALVTFSTLRPSGLSQTTEARPSFSPPIARGTDSTLTTSVSQLATLLPNSNLTGQGSPVSAGTPSSASGLSSPLPSQGYSGPETAYPTSDEWVSFNELWSLNQHACEAPANGGNGDGIRQGIQQVAGESGVDPRVILAVILQESTCQLNVPTTNGGIRNPGLMQSFNGVTYNGSDASILQMIRDGVEGTDQAGGDGVEQYIQEYGLYTGLRAYNSGPNGVDRSNLDALPAGTGTASYCSDIANRLTGAKVAL